MRTPIYIGVAVVELLLCLGGNGPATRSLCEERFDSRRFVECREAALDHSETIGNRYTNEYKNDGYGPLRRQFHRGPPPGANAVNPSDNP